MSPFSRLRFVRGVSGAVLSSSPLKASDADLKKKQRYKNLTQDRAVSFFWGSLVANGSFISEGVKHSDLRYAFAKLQPWSEDSKQTFQFPSHAVTNPFVYPTQLQLHTVPFNTERQAVTVWNTYYPQGIENRTHHCYHYISFKKCLERWNFE